MRRSRFRSTLITLLAVLSLAAAPATASAGDAETAPPPIGNETQYRYVGVLVLPV